MSTVYYCYLTNQLCIHTIKPSCCLTIFQTIQSIDQSIKVFIFSSITQQIIILKCTNVVEKKGISDKTIYVKTFVN